MESIDDLAAQARAALAGDLPTPAETGPPGGTAPTYAGSSPDGRARAEAVADGHLAHLELDADLLAEPLEDVVAAARDAVNAALDARPGRLDLSGALAAVTELEAQAEQQLALFAQTMTATEDRVRAERRARTGA